MKKIFFTVTFAALMLVPVLSFAQGHGGRKTIKCESKGERYNYCRTYTTGRVELRKRLSDAPCREYDTWGADGDGSGIWVREGCRAEFTVEEGYWRNRGHAGHGGHGGHGGYETKTIKCESKGERYSYCRTHTTGRVELRRQLSDAPCREYSTWGADGDGSGIWVREGCRAEFTVEEGYWRRGGHRGN